MAPLVSATLLILGVLSATPASAQRVVTVAPGASPHWGITASVTPHWEFLRVLEDSMDKVVDMSGDEFRVGIIRGKQLGGDWGVSYVKRRVVDGSSIVQEKPKCLVGANSAAVCAGGSSYVTNGAFLTGVQLHRFFPVATVARRVQLGALVTGGIARIAGHADETQEHLQVLVNPVTGGAQFTTGRETRSVDARAILSHTFAAEYLPVGGVEGAVAVLAAPGVKVRVSGGVSFPGMHRVQVTAQYLFGAR